MLLDELPDIITFQEVRYEHLKGGYLGPSQMKHLSDILKSYQVKISVYERLKRFIKVTELNPDVLNVFGSSKYM